MQKSTSDRRKFIKQLSIGTAGALLLSSGLNRLGAMDLQSQNFNVYRPKKLKEGEFTSQRPEESKRKFRSKAVEDIIAKVKKNIKDPELSWMFENCYPNTLDTTVFYDVLNGEDDTYIITGDIDAMWQRDSTAQVWPYMPLMDQDEDLRKMIKGLINRQVRNIILDPYANAFYKDPATISHWKDDRPKMKAGVHERKWEIDSLCYVVRLSNEYYKLSGDKTVFSKTWIKAMHELVATLRTEQRKDGKSPYYFQRTTGNHLDAPVGWGSGRPIKPVGLICSMFRPSDDACLYPFLIPSNLFAVQSLHQLDHIFRQIIGDVKFADECKAFANEVEKAIEKYAIQEHLNYGNIYAYEVDGFGNKVFMDDANVPSLMSLAYLGIHDSKEDLYKNTRRFLLSENNPYFYKGKAATGQGSPHTGYDSIWPMGIILRAMTSTDDNEIKTCLNMLKATHANTGLIHESFNKDNPHKYSRDWFAWANTLFGELIIKIFHERPHILK